MTAILFGIVAGILLRIDGEICEAMAKRREGKR